MAVLDNIREQIKVILAGVPGIGVVHDYERLAVEMQKIVNLLKDADGRINACMFTREKMAKRAPTHQGPKERCHIFLIRKIMAINDADATGIIFDDHLDAIEAEFDKHITLNQTCYSIYADWGPMAGVAGVQIEISEPRMIAGILCHYAELRLCAVDRSAR
jgi:uncharacterized protein YuzE